MCLDPVALAFQWIEDHARHFNKTAEEFIEVAMTHVRDQQARKLGKSLSYGGDHIIVGPQFHGESTPPEFWDRLGIFLSIPINDDLRRRDLIIFPNQY